MNVDIVDEILSRLPVKSLVRFKVVCKDWYFNIKSDFFITKHTKNQRTKDKLLIYHKQYLDINYTVSICSEEKEEVNDEVEDGISQTLFHQHQQHCIEDMPLPCLNNDTWIAWDSKVKIVGTCNGLVCLDHKGVELRRHITLWNPATQDFYTLPRFQQQWRPPETLRAGHHVGFGFDGAANDYKVIRISQFFKKECRYTRFKEYISQIQIYCLSTDSWKEFDCSSFPANIIIIPGDNKGTMFGKEKFCWLATDANEYERLILLSFDMSKEVFQTTPLPSDLVKYKCSQKLFQLHDSIALVDYNGRDTDNILAIWTTNDLQQEGFSWIKMSNIGPISRTEKPLGFWKCKNSDDFLFLFYHSHYSHNGINAPDWINYKNAMKGIYMNSGDSQIKNNRLMTIHVKNSRNALPIQVFTYVETLVSVTRDHDKSSLWFA